MCNRTLDKYIGGGRLAPPPTTYCGFGKDAAGRLTPNRIVNKQLAPASRPGSPRCELHIGPGGANRPPPLHNYARSSLRLFQRLVVVAVRGLFSLIVNARSMVFSVAESAAGIWPLLVYGTESLAISEPSRFLLPYCARSTELCGSRQFR